MMRLNEWGEFVPPTIGEIIGVDDALILAGIAAAGAGASYMGTKDTNSANRAMNMGAMKFNWDVNEWNMANQLGAMYTQMDYNQTMTQRAQDYAERMSNTSYQRARRDMLAAGLNPILAYQQGGASTPTVSPLSASASVGSSLGSPSMQRMENALGPAVGSALQAANTVMGVQQAAAQIDQTQANTKLAEASEANQRSQAALNSAQAITEAQRTGLVKSQRASEAVLPSLRTAQEAAASAAAVESRERAVSEMPRRDLMREDAFRSRMSGEREREGAFLTREQNAQLQRYGTGSIRGVSPSAVVQPFRSAGEWIRSFLR